MFQLAAFAPWGARGTTAEEPVSSLHFTLYEVTHAIIATRLAAQTTFGAAKMVLETGYHPALLKDAVSTPAGCTIDGNLD